MLRNTVSMTGRVVAVGALPLAAAAVFAGSACADTGRAAEPVAGIPLESEDVATNPQAAFPDPVLNGASLGNSIGSAVGSATGSVTGSAFSLLGAAIGAGVGATNPDVVPQVLP